MREQPTEDYLDWFDFWLLAAIGVMVLVTI